MSKFYVGQKVLVTGNSYYSFQDTRWDQCAGKVCKVKSVSNSKVSVYIPNESDWWYFNKSDLKPIAETPETPETLTINGVEYIRKPEPVVEHEWKFGDVAVHEEYGVGIVIGLDGEDEEVEFRYHNGNNEDHVFPDTLTFIRRTDLSV